MEFPSRKDIHEVIDFLLEEGLWSFGHKKNFDKVRDNFSIWCLEVLKNYHMNVSAGMSKIAIDFGNDDWVIKIPILNGMNYCRQEAINYSIAKKEGLNSYFAPCYFFGVVDGLEIYLQRKVEKDCNEITSSCYAYAFSMIDNENYESDEDYSDAVLEYVEMDMDDLDNIRAIIGGEEKLEEFISNMDINDLHKGNFGFLDGRAVIFDYSGF